MAVGNCITKPKAIKHGFISDEGRTRTGFAWSGERHFYFRVYVNHNYTLTRSIGLG